MRIIAGTLKGQQFAEMHKHRMHPMGEKIRGALFNVLGDVEGLSFLDAFAGSGALSLEAVSRGAAISLAIEKDKSAHKVIEENIKKLGVSDKIHVVHANGSSWSENNQEKQFDIVLLDPPFGELQEPLLQKLVSRHAKPGGIVAVSYPGGAAAPQFENAEEVARKSYGDAQLVFYRKNK